MKRLPVFVALFLWPLAALADREIAYEVIHDWFAPVAKCNDGRYFRVDPRLNSADPSVATADIKLVIMSRSGEIRVPVTPLGHADFPVRADLLEENPPVVTNVAKGMLQFNISFRVEAPPAERFPYALMIEMQDEVEAVIKRKGMLARMFMPDFEGLLISFPPQMPARAVLEIADAPVVFEADAEGSIRIPHRRDWARENPFIQLSTVPLSIRLQQD